MKGHETGGNENGVCSDSEEEAFQQLEADECTEDQCIAIIQDLLQVEYFFMFEILKTGGFQQMKITRIDLDNNRDVRTTTCKNCDLDQLNNSERPQMPIYNSYWYYG